MDTHATHIGREPGQVTTGAVAGSRKTSAAPPAHPVIGVRFR